MSIRNWVLAAAAPMLLSSATAFAANPTSQHQSTVFDQYSVAAVQPYRAQESNGYDTYPVLRGAQVYVRAREGLTAEWLNLSLQRALAQRAAEGPAVKNLKVSVVSAGAGFWVILSTDDVRSADKVLSWAHQVTANHQQVASAK
jgi:hypothetical protein